ncbi:hypothetical protein LCGC14_1885820 [marine sediment metagenome]|uniref:Uncharacterized protein n=1 Tax=marine sediment metagenome TaxID=412755 RepID=A0A0F9GPB6_9ZZZZ
MLETKFNRSKTKPTSQKFFCPLGYGIMWYQPLEYKECPLSPSHRDMPECKDCKLRIDKKWEENKETWKEPVRKKKRKPFNRKRRQGARQ